MVSGKDRLFESGQGHPSPFEFNQAVVDVFPDMIERSVPGYRETLQGISQMAAHFARDGSCCFDLGCSLGAASLAILNGTRDRDVALVAVDSSAAMVKSCEQVLHGEYPDSAVRVLLQDIRKVDISNACLVVMNYTLQFVPPAQRDELIQRIYQGLVDGGALILSEKIRFTDPALDQWMIERHHQFKRANGYSDLEISRKRDALEDVLVPETLEDHTRRMGDAGFSMVSTWFQSLNFCSMIAIR
ncbi:MAG: carboxy-S-adenosyl-L-methionine synthase CmoA [Xanthomonadales bacterium]|nr:carboxy-S-adenosyl-L-methionine synthase CmoA [Xanthomonadales bacterium]